LTDQTKANIKINNKKIVSISIKFNEVTHFKRPIPNDYNERLSFDKSNPKEQFLGNFAFVFWVKNIIGDRNDMEWNDTEAK